jgi:hypothetical protein
MPSEDDLASRVEPVVERMVLAAVDAMRALPVKSNKL